jgi:ribonucleoside-diphosphate reductase subunit M1
MVVQNMNNIIDKNFYPEYEIDCFDEGENEYTDSKPKKSIGRHNNLSYRPIGIGIQGLADVFARMKLSWESQEARQLNQLIFETIYYHALNKSHEISRYQYGPYSKFHGSPVSQGILQYDMWNVIPLTHKSNWKNNSKLLNTNIPLFEWDDLKEKIKQYGIRNSLMVAPMPTAGTSQIMGNTEAFEPLTSNLYIRKVGAGDFPVVNQYLYKDLKELGLWNKETIDEIITNNGSIQNINTIPDNLKKLYKTVWEIPQKIIVDFAADRGAFIDQTQSLNIFMERPTVSKLSSLYMYGWKRGLKTLSYYLRTKPATGAVKFSVMNTEKPTNNKNEVSKNVEESSEGVYKINKYTGQKFICTEEVCTACSS